MQEHPSASSMDGIVILVTTSGAAEAERIAAALLDQRLIACANIIAGVSSRFIWNGAVDQAGECLVVMKSVRSRFAAVCREVRAAHSYEVPEIIAIPIIEGDSAYLGWIAGVLDESP